MLIEPDLAASIAFLVIDKNKKLDRWMRWCDMSLRTPAETTAKGGELVMHKFLIASSAIAIALAARPAMAQDDAGQEEDGLVDVALAEEAEEQRQPGGLNVITVTAQRREETLQDAAIAINAASGEELMRAGVTDATGLNKVAPSLYVTTGGGANAAYFLRGVGNFTNNGFTSPAIAFNLDGVYIGRPTSTTASFLDVNRVEVLKGPQGTLYGRNATGGAINVIPNAPRLGEFSGSVSAKYGNYDAYELTGVLNAPLGDSVAVRLAGSVNGHDAYFDDGTETAEDLALRAQIFAELGEAVNVRLSADYSTQTGTGPGLNVDGIFRFQPFSPDLPVPNWNFVPAPEDVRAEYTGLHTPETLAFIGNNVAAAPLFTPYVGYVFPFRDDEYWGVNAELNFELGGVDLVVIPAYRRSELDNQFNGPPFKAAINQDVAEQYSFEARLSGEAGPIDWILGGYYFDERVRGQGTFNQFSTTANITFDSQIESLAFFGRGTFNVTDDLRLVGGLRYTDERREFDGENIGTAGICLDEPPAGPPMCFNLPTLPVGLTIADMLGAIDPALFPAFNPVNALPLQGPIVVPYGPIGPMGPGALLSVVPTRVDQAGSDEEVTYRLAVEYDVTPDNLLYASFETGFRAGGFNIVVGQESYDPEFIDAWTIGSKNSFFDNRLQVNFEAFYWEYSGQQLAALGLDANGRNAFFTRNVGESSIKGRGSRFSGPGDGNDPDPGRRPISGCHL